MAIAHDDSVDRARAVFGGLSPRLPDATQLPRRAQATPRRHRSAAYSTVPIVLTGAIALGIGVAGPVDATPARKPAQPQPQPQQSPVLGGVRAMLGQWGSAITPGALSASTVAGTAAPSTYLVQPGDTVSDIAAQFGLPTATVLARNGLSWKSTIFPGQVLTLNANGVKRTARPAVLSADGLYVIASGDTLSSVAQRFSVSVRSILDRNALTTSSIIYPGHKLVIPGHSPVDATPVLSVDTTEPATEPDLALASTEQETATGPAAALTGSAAEVTTMELAERPVLPAAPAPVAPRPPAAAANPAPSAPTGPPSSGGAVTPLTSEMRGHAQTIIQVGRQLGVPDYGIVIALATAMQESSLRNLSSGDRDSVGLFQQRPSSGWGTAADLQNPSHAARLFYVGRPGYTRGLLQITGWQSMTLTRAAQAVQISAYPNHYAKWETSAWAWFYELT